MTAVELHDVLADRGARLMVNALDQLERGVLDCTAQEDTGVTYAKKIEKRDARVDFLRPAREVHDHIRALAPMPGAWFAAGGNGERIRVLRARTAGGTGVPGTVLDAALTVACGGGAIQLLELQRAGKRAMTAAEFLRGYPLSPGTRL